MNSTASMRRIEKKRDTCGKKRNTKEGKAEHSEVIALIQKERRKERKKEKKKHGGGIEVESVKWREQWKKVKSKERRRSIRRGEEREREREKGRWYDACIGAICSQLPDNDLICHTLADL